MTRHRHSSFSLCVFILMITAVMAYWRDIKNYFSKNASQDKVRITNPFVTPGDKYSPSAAAKAQVFLPESSVSVSQKEIDPVVHQQNHPTRSRVVHEGLQTYESAR